MKKSFYSLLVGSLLYFSFSACEDDATNPGDFSLKPTLEVTGIASASNNSYTFNLARSIDTTYRYFYTESDTLKDQNGNLVKDEQGNYQITKDSIYYDGQTTGKLYEMEKIMLDPDIDTLMISIASNCKWKAPMPSSGGKVQWFFTQNLAGGGDGTLTVAVTRNRNASPRAVDAVQIVHTPDSTIMYKLIKRKKGVSK